MTQWGATLVINKIKRERDTKISLNREYLIDKIR